MTQIYPMIRNMTQEEKKTAGLIRCGFVVEHGKRIYRLSAGDTDLFRCYQKGALLCVLTVNLHLDYVAIDCYLGSATSPVNRLYLQGFPTLMECLGNDWNSLPYDELADRMLALFA